MALSGTGAALGDKIAARITAADAPADAKAAIKALWEGIGEDIVSHFIENTEVEIKAGIPVATAGSAAKQEGATTAPGAGKIL
jgi:hypothetical protein